MAISNKNIEILWGLYQSEGVSKLMKKTALIKNTIRQKILIIPKPQQTLGLWCIVIGIGGLRHFII